MSYNISYNYYIQNIIQLLHTIYYTIITYNISDNYYVQYIIQLIHTICIIQLLHTIYQTIITYNLSYNYTLFLLLPYSIITVVKLYCDNSSIKKAKIIKVPLSSRNFNGI